MKETKNYKLVKPDPEDYYDIEIINANTDMIDSAIADLKTGKSNRSLKKPIILQANAWTGAAAPYSYTLQLQEVTADNNIEINPPSSLTEEQYEQITGAAILGGGQAAGSITLLAYGDKPTIDLPIVVIIRGD